MTINYFTTAAGNTNHMQVNLAPHFVLWCFASPCVCAVLYTHSSSSLAECYVQHSWYLFGGGSHTDFCL